MSESGLFDAHSGIDERPAQKYAHLEAMSMEELQSEMEKLFETLTDTDYDQKELSAILSVMEEKEPRDLNIDVKKDLREFHEKHAVLFEQLDRGDPTTPVTQRAARRIRIFRPLAIAAILFVFMAGFLTRALGVDVLSAIASWTAETFRFGLVDHTASPEQEDALQQFSDLEITLNSYGVDFPVIPAWIPEGYISMSVSVEQALSWTTVIALLQNNEKYFTIQITISRDQIVEYEKDGERITSYLTGGIEHYIMTNEGKTVSTWKNDNVECMISGDISPEEMTKMIDSIYERQVN